MHSLIPALLIMAALSGAVPATGAPGEGRCAVTLRETATVSGDVVALGDIVDLDGNVPEGMSALPLGNAPWPGRSRRISLAIVKVRLMSAGFDAGGLEFRGGEACLVHRESRRVEAEQIVAVAKRHLEALLPSSGSEVEVELYRKVGPVLVAVSEGAVELRPSLTSPRSPGGIVRVDVAIVRDGVTLATRPVTFTVRLYQQVAVAVRHLRRGEPVTGRDIEFVRRNVMGLADESVQGLDELTGKVLARSARPGQALTHRMLAAPLAPYVIDLNQRVYVVVETGTLRAVTVGRSLNRARKGEPVRARNLTTGRELVGTAVGPGTIRIFLEGQIDDAQDPRTQ